MIRHKKIIVCCPQIVSGGPEVLHQLVDTLRAYGHDAKICYYPFEKTFQCPEIYRRYDAPQTSLVDEIGTLIIVPEASTWIVNRIRSAQCAIWWLSVDNYFSSRHESSIEDFIARWKTLVRGQRVPLFNLRRCLHFSQSRYAGDFLDRAKLSWAFLTDYLSAEHLDKRTISAEKQNIIAYNPTKGASKTKRLIQLNPSLKFVPIQNMNCHQVSALLDSAKLYVDLGYHPGKDRLPREAAMARCCVVTGTHGSAANAEDVPIPREYKLDDESEAYIDQFRAITGRIFSDYSFHASKFDDYRKKILCEPEVFRRQVREIFGHQ